MERGEGLGELKLNRGAIWLLIIIYVRFLICCTRYSYISCCAGFCLLNDHMVFERCLHDDISIDAVLIMIMIIWCRRHSAGVTCKSACHNALVTSLYTSLGVAEYSCYSELR